MDSILSHSTETMESLYTAPYTFVLKPYDVILGIPCMHNICPINYRPTFWFYLQGYSVLITYIIKMFT
jgi:hypothetical protein